MHSSQFLRPAPDLKAFVRFYAQREIRIGGAAIPHPVPARAAPMIEFTFGDPILVRYFKQLGSKKSPATVVVGPQTHRRLDLQLQGNVAAFVIMFQPDGLHRLFSIPMHELTDQDYEAHAVLGAFIARVQQRLGECTSFGERARLIDEFLLHRALAAPRYDAISAAANQIIRHAGRVAIADLAGRAGLSMRQFQRRFIQRVGMRPKLFARIARFEAALGTKACSDTLSWTEVAQEFGYHDQMHMIHDFAEFAAETPTATQIQLETLFMEQISAIRAGRGCAETVGDSQLIL
jgi:AraC-like DNA-binding protein